MYPPVPEFTPRAEGEPLYPFGQRALTFALDVSVALLPTEACEAALYVSQFAVRAPELLEPTRSKLADVRRRLLSTLTSRAVAFEQAAQADPQPEPPTAPDGPGGGQLVPKPTPPTRPSAPASRLPETIDAF